MEANAALARTSQRRVQHPIASEDLKLARVHENGQRNIERPLGLEQPVRKLDDSFGVDGERKCSIELLASNFTRDSDPQSSFDDPLMRMCRQPLVGVELRASAERVGGQPFGLRRGQATRRVAER